MKEKDYKAFIVEGEVREPQIICNMCKIHFKHSNFKILTLPAGQNIYMLWQILKADDFETDIIEVLRENSSELDSLLTGLTRDDFSEVYLFFDYDGHQNNLPTKNNPADVICEMLKNFDNETENGKLYVNYPMVEALRDFKHGICGNKKECYCLLSEFDNYKAMSAQKSEYRDFRKYDFEIWREVLNVFVMRVSCLWGKEEVITHDTYENLINPFSIYELQQEHIMTGRVFILSAFPEFLLDYFTVKFWNACIKCPKKFANTACKPNSHNF